MKKQFNPKTLKELTHRFPPFWVTALARKQVDGKWKRGVTLDEISKISGIPRRSVGRLATKLSWKDESLEVTDAFCAACGFSFFETCKNLDYIRKTIAHKDGPRFSHLTNHQKDELSRRCGEWQHINSATP